jgi:branched-chain amino acid transport system ATP-binding protein
MSAILQTTELFKTYGGVTATDGVSLSVEKNTLHAIIGPNGAGKTTLISLLSGAVKPDSGKIVFQGKDITRKPAYTRAKTGISRSYQITSLIMSMSVLDNVALAIQARSGHSFKFMKPANQLKDIRNEARQILEQIGLAGRAEELTSNLSHGEHRLVEIAIALASNAQCMMLDEPMAGLGPEESIQMIEFLKALKGTRTILLIEHDMDAVFALADTISVLVYGKVIATGEPEEIRNNEAVRHAYLGEE